MTAVRMRRALSSRMKQPTTTPRMRGLRKRTSHAANGAAITPPMSSARTMPRSIPAVPSPRRKPRLAARATMNSAVLTVPTTRAGVRRPSARSVGVVTGPQPPPPVASTKPPTSPSGIMRRLPGVPGLRRGARPMTNRMTM